MSYPSAKDSFFKKHRIFGILLLVLLIGGGTYFLGASTYAVFGLQRKPTTAIAAIGQTDMQGGPTISTKALPKSIQFAIANWDCLNIGCSQTVEEGQAQINYGCAEFVARALAYSGLIPLNPHAVQPAYDPYTPKGSNKAYDLLLITPMAGLYTLADFLVDYKYAVNIGTNLKQAAAGDIVVFNDANGIAEHTGLIAKAGADEDDTVIDAHNNARLNYPLKDYFPSFSSYYILHLV